MYLKLKYSKTCDKSEIHSRRRKYRDLDAVALYMLNNEKVISEKQWQNFFKNSLSCFLFPKSCTTQHQLKSLYHTLGLYYPFTLYGGIFFIFSVFSHSHLPTGYCPATISVALYWYPKYLTSIISIHCLSTVLTAHREIFQVVTFLL